MPTTQEWLERDPETWPQQTVECATAGCVNEGVELVVPAIGQQVVCGGCSQQLVAAR